MKLSFHIFQEGDPTVGIFSSWFDASVEVFPELLDPELRTAAVDEFKTAFAGIFDIPKKHVFTQCEFEKRFK